MTREIQNLEDMIATYTKLIDDSVAEGDEESAEALLEALNVTCDKLDALRARA